MFDMASVPAEQHSIDVTSRAQLLDQIGAGRFCNLSVGTVRQLVAEGRFPEGIRLNKQVRYPVYDLSLWLSSGCPSTEDLCRIKARRIKDISGE